MTWLNDTQTKPKLFFGLLLALSLGLSPNISLADDASDKLAANQQKLLQINQQIKNYQQQIASTQAKASSLKNEISIYNNQISAVELEISAKQTQIDDANLQISKLQELIDQKTQEIEDNKKILGQLIVELKQYDDSYALKTTIGSDNLS